MFLFLKIKFFVLLAFIISSLGAYPISEKRTRILIQTTAGAMKAELYDDLAPLTTTHFKKLIQSGFYNKLIFHRIIKGFMIQGGGYTEDLKQKKSDLQIKNESSIHRKSVKGSLAMAHGSHADSASTEFFINLSNNIYLDDQNFTVFGRIIDGAEYLDKLADLKIRQRFRFRNLPSNTKSASFSITILE